MINMNYTEKQKWLLGCINNYNQQVPVDQQVENPFIQKIVPMNDNSDYDIDMSKSNIKIQDTNLHAEVELNSINLLNEILNAQIEFKHHYKATQTGNLFIEFETDSYGNKVFRPSGLSITKAKFYFFSVDRIPLFLEVTFLKYLLENKNELNLEVKDNRKTGTDNIGNGLIVPLTNLIDLYNNYLQHNLKLKLKEFSLQKNLKK
jgi:hypothetical protein